MIFSKITDISLTAVKFPDISRFSRQVVTLRLRAIVVIRESGLTIVLELRIHPVTIQES